ncbi:MAG TPA: hypothetical protein VEK08_21970, partial [Planctomycetota bacterium]|nr:hypothetical protein [Planctomycetota bacterium]
LDAKGQLELDVRGDGKFRSIARQDVLSLSLKGEGEKPKTQAVKIEVRKKEDGSWVYRNVTHLLVRIESEQLVIVDANGNGTYNEPGVDGITWQGETFLFPLPATTERWCSATQNFTALQLGVWGENAAVNGRPLATTVPTALPVLKGVNSERVKIGLTPRPEDVKLSAELQKHCAYMTGTGQLAHAEDKSKPGYSEEGHNAGMRSILSMGTPAGNVALGMVNTYFHRQDVIRPNTVAFGVGYDGKFGGIDGRTNCSPVQPQHFPVLCPVPGQSGVALSYGKEAPDATPGDPSAGYPITVYFNTRQLKLTSHSLKALGPAGAAAGLKPGSGVNVDCYVFDPQTGASADMTGYQQCVCLIAKDPLQGGTEYEVTMNVEVDGKPWTKTWRFSTAGGGSKPKKR